MLLSHRDGGGGAGFPASAGHPTKDEPRSDDSPLVAFDPCTLMSMGSRDDVLRGRLREMYPPGSVVGDGATSAGVRDTPQGIVVLARLSNEDRLYGIPVSLADTSREFYYTDFPAADDYEWLDSVSIGMGVYFGTGLRNWARRTLVDDYIELDPTAPWPHDDRFFIQAPKLGEDLTALVDSLVAAGFDTSPATGASASGRLVTWVQSYENNSTGSPWVGHAVVAWEAQRPGARVARLIHLEAADGVPVTVLVDLAHLAAHLAGAAGATTVLADNKLRELDLVGFRAANPGGLQDTAELGSSRDRAVDTSFLDADPAGAARLLATSLATPTPWGTNRDAAGRHIPESRGRSWWHRIKHPRTGRPPRRYVG